MSHNWLRSSISSEASQGTYSPLLTLRIPGFSLCFLFGLVSPSPRMSLMKSKEFGLFVHWVPLGQWRAHSGCSHNWDPVSAWPCSALAAGAFRTQGPSTQDFWDPILLSNFGVRGSQVHSSAPPKRSSMTSMLWGQKIEKPCQLCKHQFLASFFYWSTALFHKGFLQYLKTPTR